MITRTISLMAGLFTMLILSGCAPIVVDLSGSDNLVLRQSQKLEHFDYKFVVLNRALESKADQHLFGASTFPMRTEEKPKDLVEKDIKRFFDLLTARSDDGKRIVARIDKADAYWVNPGVNSVPIVGMFTVWTANYPFTFDISITFEVEENGKVIHSYPFNQKIEIQDGDASTQAGMEKSYQRIVMNYRKMLFDALELEFIPRYLNKPVSAKPPTDKGIVTPA